MSQIDFKILTGIVFTLLDLFFIAGFIQGITVNWSEGKRIMLVDMSHVIKIIVIIPPNRFSDIFHYINKVVIKYIFALS